MPLALVLATSLALPAAAQTEACVPMGDACLTVKTTELVLAGAALADLSRLAETPWFTSLTLQGPVPEGMTVDLSEVNALTGLQTLTLSGLDRVSTAGVRAETLIGLDVRGGTVADLSFLADLPGLRFLRIGQPMALNAIPATARARLEHLSLSGPGISFDGAEALTALQFLLLFGLEREDLEGLGHLPALTFLNVANAGLRSLDGFVPGPALTEVWAKGSTLEDITALAPAVNLKQLEGKDSRIGDISALRDKHALTTLFLTGTQVTDLSPIAGLKSLQLLSFSDTPVTDIAALADMPALVAVYMNITRVTDFTPLLENPNDVMLRINSDKILMSRNLPQFIAEEGWKRGPLYSEK
ncbi:leucine-rich repeat domain-containing protein [Maliponia aquimaris]|uniref:leucine-rich repeat domain-containing protein n=1 Tax=Maliponia aquimaris TaxID=1673631 RepID=UPI0011402407|nr:leucine-rich repeat domain-containing protein [Maliponia aquimaris]